MKSDLFPLRGSREDVLEELERNFDLREVRVRTNDLADPRVLSIPHAVQIVSHDVDKICGSEQCWNVKVLKVLTQR
jgi:hypothetical protein